MFVYLIGSSEGHYKIGAANSPSARLSQLDETKLPFELTLLAEFNAGDAAYYVERKLHSYFSANRVRGEWFSKVPVKMFLSKAAQYTAAHVPTKRKALKPDIYEGTPWGCMSSKQRGKFVCIAAKVPSDIAEELYGYAFMKAATEAQLKELLKLVYLGMTHYTEAQ
jgi:hypothetical protein